MSQTVYIRQVFKQLLENYPGTLADDILFYNYHTTLLRYYEVDGTTGLFDKDYIEMTVTEMTFTPQNTQQLGTITTEKGQKTYQVWVAKTVPDNFVIPGPPLPDPQPPPPPPTNRSPIANPDSITVEVGKSVTFNVISNDTDPDGDTIGFQGATTSPTKGQFEFSPGNPNIKYTAGNIAGTDTFRYLIGDGKGGTAEGVVNITIRANGSPTAALDEKTTLPGTSVVINALSNDTDPENDNLTIQSIAGLSADQGTASISADKKSITFVPKSGFNGDATFQYSISDGKNAPVAGNIIVHVTLPTVVGISEPHEVIEGDSGQKEIVFRFKLENTTNNPEGSSSAMTS
jgi:Bacterial Ig domain